MKTKIKPIDVWYFIQGWYRYHIYYSRFLGFLMRPHIRSYILWRIFTMRRMCFYNGSCEECGCQTTALQMCNKACEGNCYPPMYLTKFEKDYKKWLKTGETKRKV